MVKQSSIVLHFASLGVSQIFFVCRIQNPNHKFFRSELLWNYVQKCRIFTSENIISLDTSRHFQNN